MLCSEKDCIGCRNCEKICPQNAITVKKNKEGFLKAYCGENCNNCGRCDKVCPQLQEVNSEGFEKKYYIVQAHDEARRASSSGGVFSVLADLFLRNNGYVCGAVWDDATTVKHIVSNNSSDISLMRGSKYVQSDLKESFEKIAEILKEEKDVLFVGTPCQVGALKRYIPSRLHSHLFTVDFLCHGISSSLILDKYVKEQHFDKELKKISFRDKVFDGWGISMHIDFADGTSCHTKAEEDLWWRLYLNNLILGEPCAENCKYYNNSRADITMADFWGIVDYKYRDQIDDGRGTSSVIINSENGCMVFSDIQKELKVCNETNLRTLGRRNILSDRINVDRVKREKFWKRIESMRLDDAASIISNDMYDVGIVGLWFTGNYGGSLTGLALYRVLEKYGYSPIFIDYKSGNGLGSKTGNVEKYIRTNCNISRKYDNIADLHLSNTLCDTFIVGSDQCWRSWFDSSYDYAFYLNFVDEDKKKLSYATSLDPDNLEGNSITRKHISKLLKSFDAISVRESQSVDFMKNQYGVDAVHTLDPILLLDDNDWNEFGSPEFDEKYSLCYFLDNNECTYEYYKQLCDSSNHKVIVLLGTDHSNTYRFEYENVIKEASLPEMINLFRGAEYVLTDSYHGMCLSIAFQKNYTAIVNERRGGSRFRSLAHALGLGDCIVKTQYPIDDFQVSSINWNAVSNCLDIMRADSLKWLLENLCKEKDQNRNGQLSESRFDYLISCINNIEIENKRNTVEIEKLRNSIIQRRERRIIEYLNNTLPRGSRVAYRGGGYHTIRLDKLLNGMFKDNDIKVVCIIDNGNVDVNALQYPVVGIDDEILDNVDYVIISSAKYRSEMIDDVEKHTNVKIIDIYSMLDDELVERQAYFEV